MKTNAERAREQLTLTPDEELTLKKDGFIGALYRPEEDEYPGKAVIIRPPFFGTACGSGASACAPAIWMP